MSGAVGLGLILFAMAAIVALHGERTIAGLDPADFAQLAGLAALGFVFMGWAAHHYRGRAGAAFQALAAWVLIFLGVVAAYGYREDARAIAERVLGDLAPGQPVAGNGNEVSVTRRLDGSFAIAAKVNGRDLRFIFDTGATAVVLTAESAERIGLRPPPSAYTVPVTTANGHGLAAPIVLDRLSIGPIAETRVRALVARPGSLHENLLGMTFLDRLASYEVRGNRLYLRGRAGRA